MGCVITFQIPGKDVLRIETDLSADAFSDVDKSKFKNAEHFKDAFGNEYQGKDGKLDEWDLYAELLISNAKQNEYESILNAIRSDKTLTYTDDNIVPNRTARQLEDEFGLTLAEGTPDILLVENGAIHQPYIKAIPIKGIEGVPRYQYVVAKNQVRQFAAFSKALWGVQKLIKEGYAPGDFNNPENPYYDLHLNELKEDIKSSFNYIQGTAKVSAETRIIDHLKSKEKSIKREKNELEIETIPDLKEKEIKYATQNHKEGSQAYTEWIGKVQKNKEKIQKAKDDILNYEEQLKAINLTLIKMGEREGNADEIDETWLYSDETISRLKREAEDRVNSKLGKRLEGNIIEILNDYIHNRELYELALAPETIREIDITLNKISQGFDKRDTGDKTANAIGALIEKTRKKKNGKWETEFTISAKDIFQQLVNKGEIKGKTSFKDFEGGVEGIKKILQEKFLDKQDYYELAGVNKDTFRLKVAAVPTIYNEAKFGNVQTFMLQMQDETNYKARYKGYYIYNIVEKDAGGTIIKNNWYFSDRMLNEYSNPRPYGSIEEVKGTIDKITPKQSLRKNKFYIPRDEGLHTLSLPYKMNIRKGEVITFIDCEPGPYLTEMTSEAFNTWFDTVFASLGIYFKDDYLDSVEKKALFYSHYGYLQDSNLVTEEIQDEVIKFVNTEFKKELCFYALDDSYQDFRDYKVNGIVLPVSEIKEKKVSDKVTMFNPDQVTLSAMVQALNDGGIRTVILSQEEFNQMLQASGLDPAKHTDAKGAYDQGIIYINREKATADTPAHELTHVLLGILKANNEIMYNAILNNVAETQEGKAKAEQMKQSYSELDPNSMKFKEEVVADLYAEYLVGKSTKTLADYFTLAENNIGQTSIFDGGKFEINSGDTIGDIFKKFSKQVRYGQKNVGFGLPIAKEGEVISLKTAENLIQELSKMEEQKLKDKQIEIHCNK